MNVIVAGTRDFNDYDLVKKELDKLTQFKSETAKNLEKIELPSTLTVIPNRAFYECGSLKEVIIPNAIRRPAIKSSLSSASASSGISIGSNFSSSSNTPSITSMSLFASFATHGCYFYPKYNGKWEVVLSYDKIQKVRFDIFKIPFHKKPHHQVRFLFNHSNTLRAFRLPRRQVHCFQKFLHV